MHYIHTKNWLVEIGAEIICNFIIVWARTVVNIVNHSNLLVSVFDKPRAVVAAPVRIYAVAYEFEMIHIYTIALQGASNRRLVARSAYKINGIFLRKFCYQRIWYAKTYAISPIA